VIYAQGQQQFVDVIDNGNSFANSPKTVGAHIAMSWPII